MLDMVGCGPMQVCAQLPRVGKRKKYKQAEEDTGKLQPKDAAEANKGTPGRLAEASTAQRNARVCIADLRNSAGRVDGRGAGARTLYRLRSGHRIRRREHCFSHAARAHTQRFSKAHCVHTEV